MEQHKAIFLQRIKEIIETSDLSQVTPKSIRLILEKEFHLDLSNDKKQLKELVLNILQDHEENSMKKVVIKEESLKEESLKEESLSQDEVLARQLQEQEISIASSRRTRSKQIPKKRSKTTKKEAKKRKPNASSGFAQSCVLGESLAEFMKSPTASRTTIVKALWDYIKSNQLQDQKDKRFILCDSTLEKIFSKPRVHMFEMNKILNHQIKSKKDIVDDDHLSSKEEDEVVDSSEDDVVHGSDDGLVHGSDQGSDVDEQPVKKSGAFHQPLQLSPALAHLIQEKECSRPQVVKLLWKYIKQHNLQDANDKRFILCDDVMFQVFKTKRLHSFSMNKLLSTHLTKSQLAKSQEIVTSDDETVDSHVEQVEILPNSSDLP